MKRMKKFASLLLALVMVLSLSTTVMAATINAPGETAGDQNAATETYTAYKIFDVTTTADGKGYSYTLSADSAWKSVLISDEQTWFDLTMSADGTVYNVALKTGVENNETTAKAVAQHLLNNKPSGVKDITISSDGTKVDNGYYLIESSVGANLVLATYNKDVNIEEKNTYPSLAKGVDQNTASIGDVRTFTITVTVPESVDKEVVVYDKMSEGLDFGEITSVKVGEDSVENTQDTTAITDYTFKVTFNADDVKGKTVVITYTATLNKDAAIYGETESNKNEAWLTYSNFTSEKDEEKINTFKFDLVKTDNGGTGETKVYNVLTGAEFELYADDKGTTLINLVKEEDGVYRVDKNATSSAKIEAGNVEIKGLADGTYYLKETKAPAGYNKVSNLIQVTINGKNEEATVSNGIYTSGGVQVVNETGTVLPSTGGMGTTIFYVIGSILVIGAAVLLVTRKRMSVEK